MFFAISAIFAISSCSQKEKSEEKRSGYLTLNISQSATLKSEVEPEDFILRISAVNTEIRKGRIGDLPEQIKLPAGSYTIEVFSTEFSDPKFEKPYYYGKTTVVIDPDVTKEASLVCSLANAGIKVVWASEFSERYSTYQAQINCNEGYLNYSSTETRTGYFLPGTVSISIMADGLTINGGSITLAAQDLVTAYLQIKNTKSGELTFTISIDNSVNEREIEIIVDPDDDDDNDIADQPNSQENPYTVAQAIARQSLNETGVWVMGYIVGSKPSSGHDFKEGPWQASNIVLADDITETDSWNCIFVMLPSSGSTRTNLNLVDNPENLSRKVIIRGNLGTYHDRSGLRNVAGGAANYSFID